VSDINITVTRSGGVDGAVLIFIDTDFEPGASDGGPGLRVLINDFDTYAGVAYDSDGVNHEAKEVTLAVKLDEIAYTGEVND
jgi:hypothetical protein